MTAWKDVAMYPKPDDPDVPHCKHCGNPYVEETVEVCCWPCLHDWSQEQLRAM